MGWFFSVLIICASLASLAGGGNQKGKSKTYQSTFQNSAIHRNNRRSSMNSAVHNIAIYGGGAASSGSCSSSSSSSCGGGGYGGC